MSAISNSSALRSLRSSNALPTLLEAPVATPLIKAITFENGVAVMTKRPNKNVRNKIGRANTSVTKATSGVETA